MQFGDAAKAIFALGKREEIKTGEIYFTELRNLHSAYNGSTNLGRILREGGSERLGMPRE